jgi:CelD/BcsL family acetyltransferase involved in cellulose biosynthesis
VRALDYTPQEWSRIAPHWDAVYAHAANPSFFLCRDWVETWLEVYSGAVSVRLLLFERIEEVIGVCLLVERVGRRGPFAIRQLHLNTAGEPKGQSVAVEFNALLCRAGAEAIVAAAFAEFIAGQRWDELYLSGIIESSFAELEADLRILASQDAMWSTDYYVDLGRLRSEKKDYLSVVSKNSREQIRRSTRLYAAHGPVEVTPASDCSRALAMLEEMAGLHQATWTQRGRPGAFSSEPFRAFHQRLIRRTFAGHRTQLLRVSAGSETVGILYFFIHQGEAHFYQSGLVYRDDNRYKPGLVSHVAAIQHWYEQGLHRYDFMAGDPGEIRYKKSLATDSRQLGWVTFERRNLKMRAINQLRALKGVIKSLSERRRVKRDVTASDA